MLSSCYAFVLHSENVTLTYTSFSLESLLDQPPYWRLREVLCFFYDITVFSHYINVISISQKLVSPIQFQPFVVLLDPPNGLFQNGVKSNGGKASPYVKVLLIRKYEYLQ
jgi:hypothetical protein